MTESKESIWWTLRQLKDPGMVLEFKLSYKIHLQSVFSRVNKAIGLFRKLQPTLMRHSMVTKQKSFIRTYLDYGDVVYNQVSDKLCHQGLKSLQ